MLYELISVVRPGSIREVKEIARTAGNLILQSNGVVRGITNWGVFNLPKPTSGQKGKGSGAKKHNVGHYFVLRFDSSPATQIAVRKTLGLEPRLLRFSVVKLGRTLKEVSERGAKAEEWVGMEGAEGRMMMQHQHQQQQQR